MPRKLRAAVPVNVLVRILNSVIWCERLPNHLTDARTIFILKKLDCENPADSRPLTIFSTLAILFHLILSKRIGSAVEFKEEQRAFKAAIDGCVDNTVLLDTMFYSR